MTHSFSATNKLTQVRNNAQTTLSVGIPSVAATEISPVYVQFPSSDVSKFLIHDDIGDESTPSTGTTHGYISVDRQLMWYDTIVTIGGNRRFKVTKRGINTTSVSHDSGRQIQLRVTAQHLLQIQGYIASINKAYSLSSGDTNIDLSNVSNGYEYVGSKYDIGSKMWNSMTGYVLRYNGGFWGYDGTWVYPIVYPNVKFGDLSTTGSVVFQGLSGVGQRLLAIDSYGNFFRTSTSGGAQSYWQAGTSGYIQPISGYSGIQSNSVYKSFSFSAQRDIFISSSSITSGRSGTLYRNPNGSLSLANTTRPIVSLSGLTDVSITSVPTRDYVLKYNGNKWVPALYNATFAFSIATFTNSQGLRSTQQIGSGNWKTAGQITFNATYNNGPSTTRFVQHTGWANLPMTGPGYVGPTTNTRVVTYPTVDSTKVFTLSATNGSQNNTSTMTFYFYNKRFWGVSSNTTLTQSQVEALTNELYNSKTKTFTVAPARGQYIYYRYPARYGAGTFTVNGFAGGFTAVSTALSITNTSGYAENYYVYRSQNSGLGSTTIGVS